MGLVILILSPFDLIPEAIYGAVGLIDDLLLILILLYVMANAYFEHLA